METKMNIWPRSSLRRLQAEVIRLQRRDAQFAADDRALRNQIDYLIREIRKTDDIIFSISQCTNWPQMQPRVAQLTDQMTARKVTESNRINMIINRELTETYKPTPDVQKLLGFK
jgi:hypothetical protein